MLPAPETRAAINFLILAVNSKQRIVPKHSRCGDLVFARILRYFRRDHVRVIAAATYRRKFFLEQLVPWFAGAELQSQ